NRHLWLCVRRSKELPEGGSPDPKVLDDLRERLRQVGEFARAAGTQRAGPDGSSFTRTAVGGQPAMIPMRRDNEAREIWCGVYSDLSAERPGLTGALLARAEAHVLRLSTLYAVLDCSTVVRPEHLLAALAVWDFCEASARYVFGDSLGDPVAD